MGSVEHLKHRLNIEKLTDPKVLKDRALWLLDQCRALTKSSLGPTNYEVQWWDIHTGTWADEGEGGTKDYCIGYVDGRTRHTGPMQVVCGEFTVYPEEWWGLPASMHLQEKQAQEEENL